MAINIQTDMIEIVGWNSGRRFSHSAGYGITGVSQGDISKVLRRVRDTQELRRHGLKRTTWQEDRVHLRSMTGNRFLCVQDKVGADWAN